MAAAEEEGEDYQFFGTPIGDEEESRQGQHRKDVRDPAATRALPLHKQVGGGAAAPLSPRWCCHCLKLASCLCRTASEVQLCGRHCCRRCRCCCLPACLQEVTDEQGRRRFHGAFTGGYSAGYFNTGGCWLAGMLGSTGD
jgi:G patch domain-containing protein 1